MTLLGRIGGLVYWVVAGHPRVVLVALGDGLPEVHGPVLEVLVPPEECLVGRVVRVPVLVLVAGKCMQVDDRVDLVPGAQFDDPVEVPEALLLDLQRTHVVLEVPVVYRQAQQVQAERPDKPRVILGEEVLEEAVEEELVYIVTENPRTASR